jgi:hypothetical protein
MDINILIQYLQIFALSAFGLFFFLLFIVSMYFFTIIFLVKKYTIIIMEDVVKLVALFDGEAKQMSTLVKSKIERVNLNNILFGANVVGGIFSHFKQGFASNKEVKPRRKTTRQKA